MDFSVLLEPIQTYHVWVQAVILFTTSLIVLKSFQLIILGRLNALAKRTTNDVDDMLIGSVSKIGPMFYFIVSLYIGLLPIALTGWIKKTLEIALIIVVAHAVIKIILRLLDYCVTKYIARQQTEAGEQQAEHTEAMLKIFRAILFVFLWASVILLILSNNGVNVTSLIASLGIGGIAVALALQNVLSDLFASFSIFLDVPFKVGDFIVFNSQSGVVERIGIRSTRIRTLHGEQLVVPNQQLSSAEIQNYRLMQRRREVMINRIVYKLSIKKLKQIPEIIKEAVESTEYCTFDRSHFSQFEDSALLFETVYYVEVPDYNRYMDAKAEINMKIFERFEKEGIYFAYPTQTVYVSK